MKAKPCGICQEPYSADLLERHHKVPRHLNGSDDPSNLIDICPVCHTSVHYLARMVKKSQNQASEFLSINYGSYPKTTQDLLVQLAKVIILEAEQSGEKEYVNVPWKAPLEIHSKLSEMAKESKCSMITLIENLVEAEHRRRKGLVKPEFRRAK